jgi:hypothetical protein
MAFACISFIIMVISRLWPDQPRDISVSDITIHQAQVLERFARQLLCLVLMYTMHDLRTTRDMCGGWRKGRNGERGLAFGVSA